MGDFAKTILALQSQKETERSNREMEKINRMRTSLMESDVEFKKESLAWEKEKYGEEKGARDIAKEFEEARTNYFDALTELTKEQKYQSAANEFDEMVRRQQALKATDIQLKIGDWKVDELNKMRTGDPNEQAEFRQIITEAKTGSDIRSYIDAMNLEFQKVNTELKIKDYLNAQQQGQMEWTQRVMSLLLLPGGAGQNLFEKTFGPDLTEQMMTEALGGMIQGSGMMNRFSPDTQKSVEERLGIGGRSPVQGPEEEPSKSFQTPVTDRLMQRLGVPKRSSKAPQPEPKPQGSSKAPPAADTGLSPPPERDYDLLVKSVGAENAQMEKRAWGVINTLWKSLSKELQEAIKKAADKGISYTEILMFDEVQEAARNRR